MATQLLVLLAHHDFGQAGEEVAILFRQIDNVHEDGDGQVLDELADEFAFAPGLELLDQFDGQCAGTFRQAGHGFR
ncbi:hypothetical protein D9M71_707130 [compost metagenome]